MEQVDASNEQHGIIISDILWTIVTQISKKNKTKFHAFNANNYYLIVTANYENDIPT